MGSSRLLAGDGLLPPKPSLIIRIRFHSSINLLIGSPLPLQTLFCLLENPLVDCASVSIELGLSFEDGSGAAVIVDLDLAGGFEVEDGGGGEGLVVFVPGGGFLFGLRRSVLG
ncbi:hypothetical protein AAC387_Pa09g1324 [Persea americana]